MVNFLPKKIFLVLLGFVIQLAFAQRTFELEPKPELKVSGTSTLHNWDMPSEIAVGTMVAIEDSGKLTEIKSLLINMPAESIKSGKKLMDKKAYDALKTKEYDSILFELKSTTKTGDTWDMVGNFSIAGVTKQVNIKVRETYEDGKYTLGGSYTCKMSEYGMKPPTAMMGTIKTGDEVIISFNVKFK